MITIERDGDRIRLVGGYTPGLGKAFPGASFSRVGGPHWSLPLTMTVCRGLRERFGNQLRVGTELSAWAYAAIEREERMATLASARDAELLRVPEVSPRLADAMSKRTYQRVGARYIAEGRAVLIAAEPGLGKTLMAIAGVIESGVPGPYCVVAPKTAVQAVWARELPRWYPGCDVVTVPDGRAARDEILDELSNAAWAGPGSDAWMSYGLDNTWVVVHPEMIRVQRWWTCPVCGKETRWRAGRKSLDCVTAFEHEQPDPRTIEVRVDPTFPQLFGIGWGAVTCDESDRVLIRKNATQTQARNGAEALARNTRDDGLLIAMSGTPFRGKPHNLWGTLNWLRPKVYSNQWKWIESYYQVTSNGYGAEIGPALESREADLYRDLDQVMLRMTKKEVAPDMPDKTYVGTPLVVAEGSANPSQLAIHDRDVVGVWLPMGLQQSRLYRQMEAEGVALVEGGEVNTIGVLAEMTRLKQFATACGRVDDDGRFMPTLPSNKFDYLVEQLEEWGYPEAPAEKLVVVSQFTQVLNLFASELDRKWGMDFVKHTGCSLVTMLTGEVTGRKRDAAIDEFNQELGSGTHAMFLNVKAGGVAITIDSADHMMLLDETWVYDDQIQVEDRIHRVSRPRPVFYHYIRSLESIDQHIAENNLEMAAAGFNLLDGRRGVEQAKRFVERVSR